MFSTIPCRGRGMNVLTAAERRLINRAILNWARLALTHMRGRVQLANLFFDLKRRPITHRAIRTFALYLENTGRYAVRIRASRASPAVLSEIENFCRVDISALPIPRQAPPITLRAFERQLPDKKIARVMREDKVISSYMLYSTTGSRVSKPSVRDAVTWTFSKTLMKDSFAARRYLEGKAASASISRKWVNFFTVQQKYPRPTKVSKANAAKWACVKLGLISDKDDQLAFLVFDLPDLSGHWRPTTFSSGGYAAFCAADHPDGLGRTMPLQGEKHGLREFVVGDDSSIVLEDCRSLGSVGVDTESLVDSARIISDLARRA
jgi:hypothetical protein